MEWGDDLVELADLVAGYTATTTPEFQAVVTAKKEFADLAAFPGERLAKARGGLFRHQELVKRYLRAYPRLIMIHEPGTGKSCSFVAFAEWARAEFKRGAPPGGGFGAGAAQPSTIRHAVVLAGSKAQKLDFKYQLACKCTDGGYEPKPTNNESAQKRELTRAISKWYTVKTYKGFFKLLRTRYYANVEAGFSPEEAMARDWSDIAIWMDEAHNLRADGAGAGRGESKDEIYRAIFAFVHAIQRSRVVLATATPMINDPSELWFLANLLLPLDRQVPRSFDFATATLEDFRPFFQGLVSFVRAPETGVEVREVGDPIELEGGTYEGLYGEQFRPQIKVFSSEMSAFQTEAFVRARRLTDPSSEERALSGDGGKAKSSGVYVHVRQAATFVFPDGHWGGSTKTEESRKARGQAREQDAAEARGEDFATGFGELRPSARRGPAQAQGFARYVEVRGDVYYPRDGLERHLKLPALAKYSCKFAKIVEHELNSPGIGYVYCNFLEGSGAAVLGLALEANGFERFNVSASIFSGAGGALRSFCGGSAARGGRKVADRFDPARNAKPRYALISGETPASSFAAVMEALTSWENRHGDIVKVVITTPLARDGTNFANVLRTYLVDAEWNPSATYQAGSRSFRATSHEDLLAERREAGITGPIEMQLFKLSADPASDETFSIDAQMYIRSERKDHYIRSRMRLLKQLAVDCQLHRARNVRPGEDGSARCDYAACDYPCADPPPPGGPGSDYSTYDVFYLGAAAARAAAAIKVVLQRVASTTLDALPAQVAALAGADDDVRDLVRPKTLVIALHALIQNRVPVFDILGYRSYVVEDRGAFFLTREYPAHLSRTEKYPSSFYTTLTVGLRRRPLTALLDEEKAPSQIAAAAAAFADAAALAPPAMRARVAALDTLGRATLVERALDAAPETPGRGAVLAAFANSVFAFPYPARAVEAAKLHAAKPGRGRPRAVGHKRSVDKLNDAQFATALELLANERSPEVAAHTVYSNVEMQSAHNQTTFADKAEGPLRLRDAGGWRTVDPGSLEFEVLNQIVQALIETNKRAIAARSDGLYGSVYGDGKFRIHSAAKQRPGAETNKQLENTGKACSSWSVVELVGFAWQKGIPPPVEASGRTRADFERIVNRDSGVKIPPAELASWPLDRLRYYASWFAAPRAQKSAAALCKALEERLVAAGEVYWLF